jgi:hypothetical protein
MRTNEPNIPKPTRSVATCKGVDVRERLAGATLECDPKAEDDKPAADQEERLRASPADLVCPRDGDQRKDEPDCEHERTADVEPRRSSDRRLRNEELCSDCSDYAHRPAEPEDPVVRRVVDEDAAQHQAEPAADSRDRRHEADAPRHALARELVADDGEAEREDAAADPLHDAPGDDDPQVRREGGDDRACSEGEQRD